MANDINQFTFTGRLGADPESRSMASGESVCNFSVACGKQWKDKASGEKREMTEWVRCAAFGKLAEICQQYLRKGSQVAAVGQLRTRKWKDKDGADRYTTEIILDHMSLMGSKPEGGTPPASKPAPAQQQKPAKEDFDDDIPFAWAIALPIAAMLATLFLATHGIA